MFRSVIGLLIPTLFEIVPRLDNNEPIFGELPDPSLTSLGLGVAALLILAYVLCLSTPSALADYERTPKVGVEAGPEEHHQAKWDVKTSVGLLAISTLAIVFMSEFLIHAVEPIVHDLGVSELFLGVILISLVGNFALTRAMDGRSRGQAPRICLVLYSDVQKY